MAEWRRPKASALDKFDGTVFDVRELVALGRRLEEDRDALKATLEQANASFERRIDKALADRYPALLAEWSAARDIIDAVRALHPLDRFSLYEDEDKMGDPYCRRCFEDHLEPQADDLGRCTTLRVLDGLEPLWTVTP